MFLDERMKLGTNWKEEIPRSIAESDVLIVLVSENSVGSDMVQEEVLIAREHHRKIGRPLFAPIRVHFSGELGYALGAYLGSYQWRDWQSSNDSPRLLAELLQLTDAAPRHDSLVMARSEPSPRTEPFVDLDVIPAPGGLMASNHPMYVQREADSEVLSRTKRCGETVVLFGPRRTGKSSMLNRCLSGCAETNKHFAVADLSLFGASMFATLGDLLRGLATTLLHELRLSADISQITGPLEMTWFIEDEIIKRVDGPFVLVIDEVDTPA